MGLNDFTNGKTAPPSGTGPVPVTALPPDETALTPGGWSAIDKLKINDQVIGSDGNAHTIIRAR